MNHFKLVWVGALALVLFMGIWFASKKPAPRADAPRSTPPEAEAEPVHVPIVALSSPDMPQGDPATARDVVDVAASAPAEEEDAAVAAAAPDRLRWQARLRLLDGSPLPSAQFVALAPGGTWDIAHVPASVDPQPPEILARGSSDDGGLLTLELSSGAVSTGGVELYLVGDSRFQPNPQSIDLRRPQPAELIYRGGTLVVQVLDGEGNPAPWASVRAHRSEPVEGADGGLRSYSDGTDETGLARLLFFESCVGEIVAVGKNGSSVARRREVHFEPSKVDDSVTLVLGQEGLTGRLKVELSGSSGTPVRDFGLRIESLALAGFRRFVDSAKIGPDGIVDGLPPGPVILGVSRVYREPPSVLRDEGIAPRQLELYADRVVEFRAVVPLAARWRRHVLAEAESFAVLQVFTRRADQGDAEWKWDRRVWQFLEGGGATQGVPLKAPGVYYSHEMDPGVYELELRKSGGGEFVWRSTVTLLEGEITALTVQL
ncbi:MAG: hypothetical protein GC161_02685 [Planctomycetaceae bacterium]|nr:hypothetical protein [Planctomycetaceae bacterium]